MCTAAASRLLVILLVILCGTANATIYVSTSGNDANGGLDWTTAKKTVQAGLNAASSGDQVWVAPGTYVERITLKAGVALYGGFAGTETELSQRNWVTNVTILDGNKGGTVVTAPTGATATTRIDGFTIRNGTSSSNGPGIYCSSSSPTICNNTITGNTVSSPGMGGGIYCSSSSPTISHNTITGNSAFFGGGIYCSGSSSSPTISYNTISGNYGFGGGIYCSGSCTATISHNTITGNAGKDGSNSAGAGIYCMYSSPTISHNAIISNNGNGICCSNSSPTIHNNRITGNTASNGGGIYCFSSSPTISHNTIVGNTAGAGAGAISCSGSSPTITSTIIALNSSGLGVDGGAPSLSHNCVYGNAEYNYAGLADPTGTNGNIALDPQLGDLGSGNIHIQPTSPCINAGDDALVQSDWTDIDGQARIQGLHVDIGADECDGTVWPTAVRYVSASGNDSSDGLTWATAKRTVQAGINAAGLGTQVWVAAGTYVGRVTLKNGVALYGGFAGTESSLSQRNWAGNVTILDGNKAGIVVVVSQWATGITRIDGFTIRNGSSSSVGGGVDCQDCCPTIANSTITGNNGYQGGAIRCSFGSPTIDGNTITGNSASYGGGIYCYYSPATITNNTISGNTDSGIRCWASSARISSNTITSNSGADSGGGIYCEESSSPTISNNTIARNSARSFGGGVCSESDCAPAISNNTITGNSASYGGGIRCSGGSTISNNTISGNSDSSGGGGIWCGGSAVKITNTIVAFNSSGIRVGGTPSLSCNCVYGNAVYDYSGMADPTGTNGNISQDPQLADVATGNVHIRPTSPCVDAGNDVAVQEGWGDIDGQKRILGSHVDIGADESDGAVWATWPAVIHVRPSGSDTADGLSWLTAKRTVQGGINAAGPGSQVWVAAGTYAETIKLNLGIALYGGFVGTETQLSQRNWAANITSLDGQKAGSVVTISVGAMAVTRIDGFTICNGANSYGNGGGIDCNGSSPTIANNTIIGNSARRGGGIYCHGYPTITNNTISANSASSYGSGICCSYSSPTITNNTITGNNGSGISCYYSSPSITNNTITGNNGSAIYCDYSSPTITNNTITGNSGGGICCYFSSSPTITNNTITGNNATFGGGIYCYYSSPTISNNIISGNSTSNYSQGGGIYCRYSSSPKISNNTITGNSASYGGGIYCEYSSAPTILNTIIAFNSSGICATGGTPSLSHSSVFGNTTYNYSGLTDPTGTNGNLSVDPQFVRSPAVGADGKWATADDDPGDLHLAAGSPCIHAGDPAYVPAAGESDMDGQPRKIGSCVDIGADEFWWQGDANCDGYVNVGDLQLLVQAWGTQRGDLGYVASVDGNRDGFVNVGDLQLLVGNWGKG